MDAREFNLEKVESASMEKGSVKYLVKKVPYFIFRSNKKNRAFSTNLYKGRFVDSTLIQARTWHQAGQQAIT